MKEELTTKMHSEFAISAKKEIEHRCHTLLSVVGGDLRKINAFLTIYEVTKKQVKAYKPKYDELLAG